MIDGVQVKKVTQHHDDRGFFCEMVKDGEETFHGIGQTSYAETYPGVIKAFHWHKKQWDIWCVVRGQAQIVLHDLRETSKTKGVTEVLYAGERNMLVVAIPPGVAHGYRVLGEEVMGIVYHTTEAYDPSDPDEERIAFDDPKIGFTWGTKNR